MQIQCTFDNRQTCPFISSRPLSAKRSPTGSATSRGKAGAAGEALSLGRAEQRLEGSAEGPPCPVLPPGRQTCPRPQSCHGGRPCALRTCRGSGGRSGCSEQQAADGCGRTGGDVPERGNVQLGVRLPATLARHDRVFITSLLTRTGNVVRFCGVYGL